jgi:dienelactone hydrolase
MYATVLNPTTKAALPAIHSVHTAMGKREKQRLAAQQAAGGEAAAAAPDAAAAERDFTKLTELADLLLNAGGELDVYSHRKEQLQRWADAVLPQTNVLAGARCASTWACLGAQPWNTVGSVSLLLGLQ